MLTIYNEDISYAEHTGRKRPWGYEIPITFCHSNGRVINQIMLFRQENAPNEDQKNATLDFWVNKIIEQQQEDSIDVIAEDGTTID